MLFLPTRVELQGGFSGGASADPVTRSTTVSRPAAAPLGALRDSPLRGSVSTRTARASKKCDDRETTRVGVSRGRGSSPGFIRGRHQARAGLCLVEPLVSGEQREAGRDVPCVRRDGHSKEAQRTARSVGRPSRRRRFQPPSWATDDPCNREGARQRPRSALRVWTTIQQLSPSSFVPFVFLFHHTRCVS